MKNEDLAWCLANHTEFNFDEPQVEVLRDSCEEIFQEQLAVCFTDELVWPRDRGFDMFRRWFDYQRHSMLDLSDEPLIRKSD